MQITGNQQSFNGSYRLYFYTPDGKRIVSDENMKKCLHYVERHLNGSKRVVERNMDLVDTFRYGQKLNNKHIGGDKDYCRHPKIRAVFKRLKERKDGFVRIVTGKDAEFVDENFGKAIGRAKRQARERAGSARTFETSYAVDRYFNNSVRYADSINNGEKAFGVAFTPVYKKNGEIKGFAYHHAGYFKESRINPDSPTL